MTATTPGPILDANTLAKIKALAEAATPFRWEVHPSEPVLVITGGSFLNVNGLPCAVEVRADNAGDAVHIARMDPPTTLALLDMLAQRDARIAELEEALRPFAEYARLGVYGDDERTIHSNQGDRLEWAHIRVGDLRRAARVLAPQDQDGEAGR